MDTYRRSPPKTHIQGPKTRLEILSPLYKDLTEGTLKEIAKEIHRTVIIQGSADREVCGILQKVDNNGKFKCVRTNKGQFTKEGRPYCVIRAESDYEWHTHPRRSKIYPSVEDLLTMLCKPIKKSVLFTLKGFWIFEKNASKDYVIDKQGEYYNTLKERLDKRNAKLYYARVTEKGKEYNQSVFRQYSEGVHEDMDKHVTIKFYAMVPSVPPHPLPARGTAVTRK
jgi:hypothetical protein